ncbi:MAG: hypothetical protein V4666_12345 [Bacteroidota bacterium]
MKKIALIAFGSLFLASCGPRRLGCGPYRRCEVKLPTLVNSEINKTQVS